MGLLRADPKVKGVEAAVVVGGAAAAGDEKLMEGAAAADPNVNPSAVVLGFRLALESNPNGGFVVEIGVDDTDISDGDRTLNAV